MAEQNTVELLANHIQSTIRQQFAGGSVSGRFNQDAAHPGSWAAYGYVENPTFNNYYSMYNSLGMARRFVDLMPEECWSVLPTIAVDPENKNDKLLQEIKELDRKVGLRAILTRADKAQSVGRYGSLFLELKDNTPLEQETKGVRGIDGLQGIKVLFEAQLEPSKWVTDQRSPLYGTPLEYNINERNIGGNDPDTGRSGTVHASRVITLAEGANGPNSIYGESALKPVINSLITAEKIIGAGGEAVYKNAKAMQLMKIHDGAGVADLAKALGVGDKEAPRVIQEAYTKATKGFNEAYLYQGMDISQMQIALDNTEPHFKNAIIDVAMARGYPASIFAGQQTGRLASDEDQYQLSKQVNTRREGFCTDSLRKIINHLMDVGVLTKVGQYEIKWPDPFAPATSDKIANFKALMEAFKGSAVQADPDKLAQVAGFDPDEIEPFKEMLGIGSDMPGELDE